jgi:esterase/lipase superfamily enzyme
MTQYAISTRRLVGGANRRFEAEPGPPTYLASPDNAGSFLPDAKVNSDAAWARQIVAELPTEIDERTGKTVTSGDLVFLVHGFNTDADHAFAFHKRVSAGLNAARFPHVLVSFDWPSRGTITNYLEDSHDAEIAAPMLVTGGIALFARFTEADCRTRVHLIAHSMGAYVTREAFRQSEGHPPASKRAWGLTQLVLVAADISSGSLTNNLSYTMRDKSQRVTNYSSKFDAALATSNIKRFASSPRAGRHGVPEEMLDKIVDVDCSDRWTVVREGSNLESHGWYFRDDDVFYPDLAATLRGDVDRARIATREPIPGKPGRLRLVPQRG